MRERVEAECGSSDHWPPELFPASLPLAPRYLSMLTPSDPSASDPPLLAPDAPRGGSELPVRAASCYATPTHFCVHLVSQRGRLRYSVDSGRGSIVGASLSLMRLVPYTFQLVDVPASQPFVFSDSPSGPDRRIEDAATQGAYPAAGKRACTARQRLAAALPAMPTTPRGVATPRSHKPHPSLGIGQATNTSSTRHRHRALHRSTTSR